MDDHSSHENRLLEKEGFTDYPKRDVLLSSGKWILRGAMWIIFVTWLMFIFVFPSEFGTHLYQNLRAAKEITLFGVTGSIFLFFSAPILLIALLGSVYLALSGEDEIHGAKISRNPSFRLWTFPVLVDWPFGVVSAAEIIGILLFILYVIWAVCAGTLINIESISSFRVPSEKISIDMLELTALRLGLIGLFCLGFLFLPVARGSVLLRLIDIPFEHAIRYHIWLGHLTMMLFTLHALFNMISWSIQGRLIQGLMEWKSIGIANLPGLISLSAGLLIWVTSLVGVRTRNFELFFYTHQLYIVFVVFLALHIGDFRFCIAAGPIFLFMLDRFLRFWQSRKNVHIVSAKSFSCGTTELVLSKPSNLRYNALGWIFLQIHELSWLQWHPFSISSSPLDGKHHLSILIKGLGDWSKKLEDRILSNSEQGPEVGKLLLSCCKITASVEGPYGHESAYHLTYENLILVAGGIGISPFLAIMRDILHRINDGKPCLPKNVLIVWAVKTSDELPLLNTVDMESISPISEMLNLEIRTYVTRESEPPLEEAKAIAPVKLVIIPASKRQEMSVLVGTGSVVWSGMYVIVSTFGLVVTVSLLDILYINPYKVSHSWYKGLLFFGCMVVSIFLFGGLVIALWYLCERNTAIPESEDIDENGTVQQNVSNMPRNSGHGKYVNTISYGHRPDFRGIFYSMSDQWEKADIGVIVCGPRTLQMSVARECRTKNLRRKGNQSIFHFHSHGFDI